MWGRSSDGTLTQTGRERAAITVRVGQTTAYSTIVKISRCPDSTSGTIF
jgi:hypothetical protein